MTKLFVSKFESRIRKKWAGAEILRFSHTEQPNELWIILTIIEWSKFRLMIQVYAQSFRLTYTNRQFLTSNFAQLTNHETNKPQLSISISRSIVANGCKIISIWQNRCFPIVSHTNSIINSNFKVISYGAEKRTVESIRLLWLDYVNAILDFQATK